MKRYFSQAVVLLSTCAALGLSACGTTEAGGGTTGNTDATADSGPKSETTTGTDAVAEDDKGAAGSDSGPAADTGPAPCGGACKAEEICDTGTNKCIDKPKPCGGACKAEEICDTGTNKCFTQTCKFPTSWGKDIQKMTKLGISKAGMGCDLNDDGKPDNALGTALASFKQVGDALTKAIADGTLVLALEPNNPGYKTDGSKFDINLLIGSVDPSNKDCDVSSATANCKYTVNPTSYNVKGAANICPPLVTFTAATVTSQALKAGGKDQLFVLNLPVVGINLALTISQAQLLGTTADKETWKSTTAGQVCGVITKDDLVKALDAVPEEQLASLGGKTVVLGLLNKLLKADIVTPKSSDGKPDAVSVSLDFESGAGQFVAMTSSKAP